MVTAGVVASSLSWAGARSQVATPAAPAANLVTPRGCAGCHAEVTREWQESLHAQSFRDPIFQAEFQPHPAEDCVACHAPLATNLVAPAEADAREGVGCVSCHMDAAGHILGSARGRQRSSASAPAAAGQVDPPHPVQRSGELGSAGLCARGSVCGDQPSGGTQLPDSASNSSTPSEYTSHAGPAAPPRARWGEV